MTTERPQSHLSLDSLGPELFRDSELQLNLRQTIIVVTEDKALLCLKDYESNVARQREWVAPTFGLVAILLALVSATFRDIAGISAETWQAIFWIAAVATTVWLVYTLVQRKRHQSPEDIVKALMAAGQIERVTTPNEMIREAIIVGTWRGELVVNEEVYTCELDITNDVDNVVVAHLLVTRPEGELVRQKLTGTRSGGNLSLIGELIDQFEDYNADNLDLEVVDDGTRLTGTCNDGKAVGTAEFARPGPSG